MLSKKLSEADVTMMFAPYGTIDDCVVLKDAKGDSKGSSQSVFPLESKNRRYSYILR